MRQLNIFADAPLVIGDQVIDLCPIPSWSNIVFTITGWESNGNPLLHSDDYPFAVSMPAQMLKRV